MSMCLAKSAWMGLHLPACSCQGLQVADHSGADELYVFQRLAQSSAPACQARTRGLLTVQAVSLLLPAVCDKALG